MLRKVQITLYVALALTAMVSTLGVLYNQLTLVGIGFGVTVIISYILMAVDHMVWRRDPVNASYNPGYHDSDSSDPLFSGSWKEVAFIYYFLLFVWVCIKISAG